MKLNPGEPVDVRPQCAISERTLPSTCTGLTKRFGTKTAVDHIDIAVPEGEVWGFLGPNGSGKTTTIRMLCGLLRADEGQGTCLG